MSLPEITTPWGTPEFLVEGHALERRSIYSDWKPVTGHARRRRTATAAPHIVSVGWILTSAEMVEVDAWFDTALQAGTRKFAARIAALEDTAGRWWEAQWLAPYSAEPLPGGELWRVTGRLLLTGEPSFEGPVSTSAAMEIRAELVGAVTYSPPQYAAMEVGIALRSFAAGAMEVKVALRVPLLGGDALREDGGEALREAGGKELRE